MSVEYNPANNVDSANSWSKVKDVEAWLSTSPSEDEIASLIGDIEQKNRRGLVNGLQKRGLVMPLTTIANDAGAGIHKIQTGVYLELKKLGLHPIHVSKANRGMPPQNYYYVFRDEYLMTRDILADNFTLPQAS